MSKENACVVPGFGLTQETATRSTDRKWNERDGNANDVIVTYLYDQYTSPEWAIDKVRKEITDYCHDFKKKTGQKLFEDPTFTANFRKALNDWHERTIFTEGRVAEVMVVMCVDVKRTSTSHVSLTLGVHWSMNLVSKLKNTVAQLEAE